AEKKNQTGELSLVNFDKTAKPGQEVTLTAKADPGIKVKIEANGAGFDLGLGDQTANDQGEVAWKWKVDKNYKADKMPVILTAMYDNLDKKLVTELNIEQPKDKQANFNSSISLGSGEK